MHAGGGASVLTSVTELAPAAGEHAAIAPARYSIGKQGAYAYESRYIDGQAQRVVIVDGKASTLNRMEVPLRVAVEEGHETLARLPHVRVTYGDQSITDLELPHRVFDGHVRAGSVGGVPVTQTSAYRALRDCTPANARALLSTSPTSVVFGVWDSTRRSHQVRFPSTIRGEIIGVLADQDPHAPEPKRGGARKDDLTPSVKLEPGDLQTLLDAQKDELSPRLVEEIEKNIKKAKKGERLSGSPLGLGAIPPSLETLGLVSCRRIIRSHVLSFATLRQLRFDSSAEGNAACRALLAALALNGMARADAELHLRANCDLIEVAPSTVLLDQRYGSTLSLAPLDIPTADALLADSLAAAEQFGVDWSGQVFEVTGNPSIMGGALADTDEQE